MLSPLRNRAHARPSEPFGKAGLTFAVIALVFAMLGGAYAATQSAVHHKKTKVVKGPRGPKGPAGPAGATGPAGPAGAKGDTGAAGANGANGSNGTNGVGVTSEQFGVAGKEGHCIGTGGSKFTSASGVTFACNGEDGEQGEPWPAGYLPKGVTETGTWAFVGGETATPEAPTKEWVPISFAIPLAEELEASEELEANKVHYRTQAGFTSICTGSLANPTAPEGQLCVYRGELEGGTFVEFNQPDLASGGVAKAGGAIQFSMTGPGHGAGTWAVTGFEPASP